MGFREGCPTFLLKTFTNCKPSQMQNKKSVLLYCDIIHTVEKLDDETAGKLFKHYLRYINDLDPTTDNIIVDISFEPIKQNLKRDLLKWDERAEKSRLNGSKGGRPKKEPKEPSRLIENPTLKNKPVKGKVRVKGNVKVKDINKKDVYLSFDHLSITKTECNKLAELGYTKNQIENIFESIQNFKGNNKYKSLYITSKKWLEREYGKPKEQEQPKGQGYWLDRPDGTGKAWVSTEKS